MKISADPLHGWKEKVIIEYVFETRKDADEANERLCGQYQGCLAFENSNVFVGSVCKFNVDGRDQYGFTFGLDVPTFTEGQPLDWSRHLARW